MFDPSFLHILPALSRWMLGSSLLFLLACGGADSTTPPHTQTEKGDSLPVRSEAAPEPENLEFLARIDSFRQGAYIVVSLNPRQVDLRLFNQQVGGGVHTFSSVAEMARQQGKQLRFACNGGMFQADRTAQGLFIAEGITQREIDLATEGYGNFYLQPNGVFAVSQQGEAFVLNTQDFEALSRTHPIRYATQSGPMMVIDGQINSLFNDGSPNLHVRNAVGTTSTGKLVFAKSLQEVTFFELSSLMIQQGCTQALYLDGFVSHTYLPEMGLGSLEAGKALGPIIAILEESPSL